MAISIDYIRPWTQAEATAGQTVFSTIWTADKATDILVYARATGVEARDVNQLVSSNDYTVQFIGAGLTVQVTFLAGRTLDDVITIVRDTPADKMNLYSNTNFKPSMLNSDFERIVMMIQQSELYDKDLSPRYNTSETPYGVDENNPPNFNRIIDLYLPLLPPLHVWRKNAANTRIEAVLFAGGGDDGGGTTITVPQPTGGLYDGAWVRWDTVTQIYIPALGNNEINAEVVGCVASITDANNFVLQEVGPNEITFAAFPQGIYFLSTTIAGGMTLSTPQNSGEVSVPVLDKSSNNLAFVMNYRGKILGTQDPGTGVGSNELIVVQPAHGFMVMEALRADPVTAGFYIRAQADTETNAQAVGIVTEVIDVNTFRLQTHGYTSAFGALTPFAQLWYLSDVTPGLISLVKPTAAASWTKPMFVVSTAGAGFILEDRVRSNAVEDTNIITLPQPGPPFAVNDWLRPDASGDSVYALGLADSLANSKVTGVVIESNVATFTLQTEGFTNALTQAIGNGEDFWLSATTPGLMVNVEPTANGEISKPLFKGADATAGAGYVLEQRPMVQPNANGGGGGNGAYNLLFTQVENDTNNFFELPTLFSDNPTFTRFRVEFDNVYIQTGGIFSGLGVQYYIGGVLQTAANYSWTQLANFSAIIGNNADTSIMIAATQSMGVDIVSSVSGFFEIDAPRTNGSPKSSRGQSSGWQIGTFGYSYMGNFHVTAPLDGIRVFFNLNPPADLLTGTFRFYGK